MEKHPQYRAPRLEGIRLDGQSSKVFVCFHSVDVRADLQTQVEGFLSLAIAPFTPKVFSSKCGHRQHTCGRIHTEHPDEIVSYSYRIERGKKLAGSEYGPGI